MASNLIKSLARSPKLDQPQLVFFSLIGVLHCSCATCRVSDLHLAGNDVCDWEHSIDHMVRRCVAIQQTSCAVSHACMLVCVCLCVVHADDARRVPSQRSEFACVLGHSSARGQPRCLRWACRWSVRTII